MSYQNKNQVILIESKTSGSQYWRDFWAHRELLLLLSWRDFAVRYKQTVIGVGWALIKPLAMTVVFTVVFSKIAKLSSGDVPYPVMVLAALLPWAFFSSALSESANSLISNADLVTKVYFPRIIIPATVIMTCLVDFLIAAGFLGVLMAWYAFLPSWRIFAVPIYCILAVGAAMGPGLWLATWNVKYRDFRYIVPFIVQFGLYISPVGYSSDVVPEKWRLLFSLNPMVGVIDGFRWAIAGADLYWPGQIISIASILLIFISGIWFFRKREVNIADII